MKTVRVFMATVALVASLTVAAGASPPVARQAAASIAIVDTYPAKDKALPCERYPYNVVGSCPRYDWGPIRNGSEASTISPRTYGYRNCTDWVAWRLQQLGVKPSLTANLGNAYEWPGNATARRLHFSTSLRPGMVAVRTRLRSDTDFGHVAFIEAAAPNGSITWTDYNADGTGAWARHDGSPSLFWSKFDTLIDFGLNLTVPNADLAGKIVQWSGDTKPQLTSWLVIVGDDGQLHRRWVTSINQYWCLRSLGHDDSGKKTASTLNALPDQWGQNAADWCPDPDALRYFGRSGKGGGASSGGPTLIEQQGSHGVDTFSDYRTASGLGTWIAPKQYVEVSCKVYDPTIPSVNPDGYWYRIASSPWNDQYYAPANTFMNGDPWGGPYTHDTDFNVHDCSSYPQPPVPVASGISEQQGHRGVNTFTDYHGASGPGARVAAASWVQVSCKVYDPTIASVNPDGFWYRIASSPWNDQYYAPANTFMNGDPWNGPYTHNTDFNVPDCGAPPTPPTGISEQQGHYGVDTFTDYHNASGMGLRIDPAAWIQVSCKVYDPTIASVNPDGYWYRISSSPWNDQYYAPANTFMNGDPWNGPYTHNTDFNVSDCSDPPPPVPGTAEQQGHYGVNTFTDYHNASGMGTSIAAAAWVQVSCKVYDPTIPSVNPDGYWYRIASSPWNDQYYAPANTFMNGDPWGGPYTHNTDFNVPDCSAPPQTYAEQQGSHGVNTFTDYHNASGMGTSIAAAAWVQVSCKVYDPTIPSVNPDGYWYRIASSPWNDQYYAPANTFMNGDPWGGPYTHNTDFNVPDC